jgi:hypothetical protein
MEGTNFSPPAAQQCDGPGWVDRASAVAVGGAGAYGIVKAIKKVKDYFTSGKDGSKERRDHLAAIPSQELSRNDRDELDYLETRHGRAFAPPVVASTDTSAEIASIKEMLTKGVKEMLTKDNTPAAQPAQIAPAPAETTQAQTAPKKVVVESVE